jgi:hypothetical protein
LWKVWWLANVNGGVMRDFFHFKSIQEDRQTRQSFSVVFCLNGGNYDVLVRCSICPCTT